MIIRVDQIRFVCRSLAWALLPAALLSVRPAAGQNALGGGGALGTGNALDRNLDPRFSSVNPSGPNEDYARRNLIITRNVTSGRGFRGAVGYEAPGAFTGFLGSDDNYDFRADSALSNVNFVQYGNTFERLRFGQDLAIVEFMRPGMESQARVRGIPAVRDNSLIANRLRLDRLSEASTTLAGDTLRAEPLTLGGFVDEEGRTQFVHTSSVSGVGSTPSGQMSQMLGLSSYDKARLMDDLVTGRKVDLGTLGRPFSSSYQDLLETGGESGASSLPTPTRLSPDLPALPGGGAEPVSGRVDTRFDAAVRAEPPARSIEGIQAAIAERFAERADKADRAAVDAEDEAAMLRELEDDMARLRAHLAGGQRPDDVVAQPFDPDDLDDPSRPAPDAGVPSMRDGLGAFSDPTAVDEEPLPPGTLQPAPQFEDFGVILRHGKQIDALASGDRTRFDELVTLGEESLREGDYFWAERRFNRALRFAPGHPLATAGMAHAQIGAGLYVSASLALRSLFTYQPEMIDVRYAPALIPNRPRLLTALQQVNRRLEVERNQASRAFLYAYVGRLLDDRAVIERGLEVMEAAEPDDPMLPLLKSIWLASE